MAAPARRSTASKVAIPQLTWDQIRPAAVVLVTGAETVLADRSIRLLRDTLKAEDPSLEVVELDAAAYAPGELLTMASPSLFGEPRFIRVANVEKTSDAFLDEVLGYLDNPADDTYLVLRHGGGVRGKKLLDAIRSGTGGGIEVVCAELKRDSDKLDFVHAEFAAARRRATPAAQRALLSAFSGDLAELAAAIRQLLADTDDEITEQTVARYYGGRVETNAFAVADAAIAGRHGDALALLRHALATGADPVPMIAAIASKIRTMAKLAGASGGSGALAQRFGLAPSQVKGGGRDPVYALERLIETLSRRG